MPVMCVLTLKKADREEIWRPGP